MSTLYLGLFVVHPFKKRGQWSAILQLPHIFQGGLTTYHQLRGDFDPFHSMAVVEKIVRGTAKPGKIAAQNHEKPQHPMVWYKNNKELAKFAGPLSHWCSILHCHIQSWLWGISEEIFISCWEVAEEAFEDPGLPMQFCWMPGKAVILCVVAMLLLTVAFLLEKASFFWGIFGVVWCYNGFQMFSVGVFYGSELHTFFSSLRLPLNIFWIVKSYKHGPCSKKINSWMASTFPWPFRTSRTEAAQRWVSTAAGPHFACFSMLMM